MDGSEVEPWLWIGGAGMLGRAMYHARQVQLGKRKPLSWVMIWDIPIALCMGWIAMGAGHWLNLEWEPLVSLSMVASYLGPFGIDTLFEKWSARLGESGKKPGEKESENG